MILQVLVHIDIIINGEIIIDLNHAIQLIVIVSHDEKQQELEE